MVRRGGPWGAGGGGGYRRIGTHDHEEKTLGESRGLLERGDRRTEEQ
jgi:hypothetical protein